MKNKKLGEGHRILQSSFNIKTDPLSSYMILVETIDDKPIGIFIIETGFLLFIDWKYRYYQINPN